MTRVLSAWQSWQIGAATQPENHRGAAAPREKHEIPNYDFAAVRATYEKVTGNLWSQSDLVPEEETPEFGGLATSLQLRGVRALEHWQGNTHLTLAAIIVRTVKESMRRSGHTPM